MAYLKQEALKLIRSDEQNVLNIARGMKTVFRTVERWIRENKPDGPLTKISALEIIKNETGLTEDQILEKAASAKKEPVTV